MFEESSQKHPLKSVFWSESWLLGTSFLFSFFFSVLMLTSPMFMLLIYDKVLNSRSLESLTSLFILVVFLFCIMGLLDYARKRTLARFAARFQKRLEDEVLNVEQQSPSDGLRHTRSAMSTSELDGLRRFFHSGSIIAIFDAFWAPLFVAITFFFHHLLGWITVSGVAVILVIHGLRAIFTHYRNIESKRLSNKSTQVADEIKRSWKTVLQQNMSHHLRDRWQTAREHSRNASVANKDLSVWFDIASKTLRLIFHAALLSVGAYLILDHKLTVGAMIACAILLNRVFFPVDNIAGKIPAIKKAINHWQALEARISEPSPSYSNDAVPVSRDVLTVNAIRLNGARGCADLLHDIDFTIKTGELIEITGLSGSGKSILCQALVGAIDIDSGCIQIGSRNIKQIPSFYLSQHLGFLPDTLAFYPGTIGENICSMDLTADKPSIVNAAKLAGCHKKIEGLPNGYATQLDTTGSQISTGLRQQIALARALFGKPELLILDEPGTRQSGSAPYDIVSIIDKFRRTGGSVLLLSRRSYKPNSVCGRYRLQKGELHRIESPTPQMQPDTSLNTLTRQACNEL